MDSDDLDPYVIRQGDYLRQLAYLGGYDAEEVWNHPLNEELRSKRDTGDDLLPGDVLFVPRSPELALELTAAAENDYTAVIPRTKLELFFEDTDGPIANEPCQIFGIPGTGEEGLARTSDGDGKLVLHVPVTVPEVTVTFPERHRSFGLKIGHMDPVNEQSGIVKRLANLGYLEVDTALDGGDMAGALAAFQRKAGLEVTGQPDEATEARLAQEAGIPPATMEAE